jgi:hypothetical protein
MRFRTAVLATLLLSSQALADPGSQDWPVYVSVADPAGQRPTAILIEGQGTSHFGHPTNTRSSLIKSDIGFQMYFRKVDGGVRLQDHPIVVPDGTRTEFDFDDFQCTVRNLIPAVNVMCRSKADGRLYTARIQNGGLLSFEMRCARRLEYVCHYELRDGQPIKPTSWAR